MTMSSGPFAGLARQIFLDQFDPIELLSSAVRHGWHWDIDYSQATPREIEAFFPADVRCRAELAEKEGRLISIGGMFFETAAEFGRALLILGDEVFYIARDDEAGFWVKSVDPEPTKH
jgi:hypothetical protein